MVKYSSSSNFSQSPISPSLLPSLLPSLSPSLTIYTKEKPLHNVASTFKADIKDIYNIFINDLDFLNKKTYIKLGEKDEYDILINEIYECAQEMSKFIIMILCDGEISKSVTFTLYTAIVFLSIKLIGQYDNYEGYQYKFNKIINHDRFTNKYGKLIKANILKIESDILKRTNWLGCKGVNKLVTTPIINIKKRIVYILKNLLQTKNKHIYKILSFKGKEEDRWIELLNNNSIWGSVFKKNEIETENLAAEKLMQIDDEEFTDINKLTKDEMNMIIIKDQHFYINFIFLHTYLLTFKNKYAEKVLNTSPFKYSYCIHKILKLETSGMSVTDMKKIILQQFNVKI